MTNKIITTLFFTFMVLFYGYALYCIILMLSGFIPTDRCLLPAYYQWML